MYVLREGVEVVPFSSGVCAKNACRVLMVSGAVVSLS